MTTNDELKPFDKRNANNCPFYGNNQCEHIDALQKENEELKKRVEDYRLSWHEAKAENQRLKDEIDYWQKKTDKKRIRISELLKDKE